MGCGIFQNRKKSKNYYILNYSLSRARSKNQVGIGTRQRRQSYIEITAPKDFWASSPYFFLCNRMNHLRNEIENDDYFENILEDSVKILSKTIDMLADSGNVCLKAEKFTLCWIRRYKNSLSFIKALGLKLKRKKFKIMNMVTLPQITLKLNGLIFFKKRFKFSEIFVKHTLNDSLINSLK